jgi:DNA-directed RNA polymerase subunit beta
MPTNYQQPDSSLKVSTRALGDATATKNAIYGKVLDASKQIPSVSNKFYSLAVEDPHYADDDSFTLADQKKAILEGKTMARRLRGTWHLKDLEGNTVEKKLATLAQVPHMTKDGTFVLNGNAYSLGHQARLRAGIYHRIKENGEIEAHVNVLPGEGFSHHYYLEPSTGVFKIQIKQSSIPLLPVLKALGATDKELSSAWGRDLLAQNQLKDDPRAISKLYDRIGKKIPDATEADKEQVVRNFLTNIKLDPEVTHRTLHHPYDKLGKEAIIASTQKLAQLSRGEAEADDRDHPAFQNFYGPEDLLSERLIRSKPLLNQLLWKATNKKSLATIPAGAFTRHVHSAILDSGVGVVPEQVNPLETLDQQTRVTRMGQGGIPSLDAVPDEARGVQPGQFGYVDLVRTPESMKAGVDARLAYQARLGTDKRIYAPFKDARTGKTVWKAPQEIADLSLGFPGPSPVPGFSHAITEGRAQTVDPSKIDVYLPHMEHSFSALNNLVPGKSMIKGQRAAMASRFLTQALPLVGGEAPLVRNAVPNTKGQTSFDEFYGEAVGAVRASAQPGRVKKITPDAITVKYEDGSEQTHELYNRLPGNRKTQLHNTPMVQAGDAVQPNQLLAKSNYTDDKGYVALGRNLRVAYIPFHGRNYEDAIIISQSAADKLTSEHLYQHALDWDDKIRKGKSQFVNIFPATYDKKILSTLDEDGVVKVGTKVKFGDPLVLATKPQDVTHKKVYSPHKGSFSDASLTWEHHSDGEVVDVSPTSKGVNVAVRSTSPSQVGDKLSNRYGGKGVISEIVPDDQMPHDSRNMPIEIALNSHGTISRTNPAQNLEVALGKIAERTGQPYNLEDFNEDGRDMSEWGRNELRKHNLNDLETVTDPSTGKQIPNVAVGNTYMMKLHHVAESKSHGRGLGSYTAEDEPAKGGGEGGQSKRFAMMDTQAMASHNAFKVLEDAKMVRGQKNQAYWAAVMSGDKPPTPGIPIVYDKFINQLRGSGVNVVRDGTQTQLMAMTDADVNHLAGDRELRNANTVDWKGGLKPVPGGLFDTALTGGHSGNRWAKITLAEPMPSPIMEEPIKKVLGLTGKQFEGILEGKVQIGGRSGSEGLLEALKGVNVKQALVQAREDIKSGRKTARDVAIKKLGFLKAAESLGIHPKDWMMTAVPVIPPMFRPVSVMQGTGGQLVSDANLLYKEVFDSSNALRNLKEQTEDVGEERLNLYKAFKGVTGLGDPIQAKNQEKGITGFLGQIFSTSPKFSTIQRKLLSFQSDLVGRAVSIPNPDLNMDQVALPMEKCWSVYTPFVVRRLVRKGVSKLRALEYVQDRNQLAKDALLQEMYERPVIINRAPVLHKYGIMAFKPIPMAMMPKATQNEVLQTSPVINQSLNLDHDGNCVDFDEKIIIKFEKGAGHLGADFVECLQVALNPFFGDVVMSVTGKTMAQWFEEGNRELMIPIGEFPRTGEVIKSASKPDQEIYKVPDGVQIQSYDTKTGKIVYRAIKRFTVDKQHECVEVVTTRGRTIGVSDNESLCVFDQETGALAKRAPRNSIGKYMAYIKNDPHFGFYGDRELGWLYGVLVADGWVSKELVGYSKNDPMKRAEVIRLMRSKIDSAVKFTEHHEVPDEINRKFGESNDVRFRAPGLSKKFLQMVHDDWRIATLSIYERAACYKMIPQEILLNGTRECLLGMLAGLIEGDCSIGWNKTFEKKRFFLRFNTSSPYLVESIKVLLRKFGVRYSVTTQPPRKASKEAYIVCPSVIDIQKVLGECKFASDRTNELVQEFLDVEVGRKTGETWDLIPVSTLLAVELSAICSCCKQMTLYSTCRKALKSGALGRYSALKLIEMVNEKEAEFAHPHWNFFLNMVANTDVHWEAVERIDEVYTQDVFDFEIEGEPNFATASGLICWDTMNYHVPASEEARMEALEKLLPSKNLLSVTNFKPVYQPRQDYVGGLYDMTKPSESKKHRTFATEKDALAAYQRGEIDAHDRINILKPAKA